MPRRKLVIYLIAHPFTARDYDRFGVERWINRGWVVKFYDLTPLIKPKFFDYIQKKKGNSYFFDGLTIFNDEKNVITSLEKIQSRVVFVNLINVFCKKYKKIIKVAQKKGYIIRINLGTLPSVSHQYTSFLKKIRRVLNNPKLIFQTVNNIRRKFSIDDSTSYLVVGGSESVSRHSQKYIPNIINAHNLDYDFIFKEVDKKNKIDNKWIVFLDGDGPYHHDIVYSDLKPDVTAKKYYPTMNSGLVKISQALDCELKIAAHPRSDYSNKDYKYNFPILKNKTFELIKQASVVVSHGSTALQWAIIMKKPIILVTTNEMKKSDYNHVIESFAFELDKEIINLDDNLEEYDWKSQIHVNDMRYKKYIESFVKQAGTPEKPVWEIVIDRIEVDLF